MSEETVKLIGKILDKPHPRDAIHVAVVSVIASISLYPGQDVGVISSETVAGEPVYRVGLTLDKIGVIDPYLKQNVNKGECCWLFLYPGQVNGLRHHYTHPALDGEVGK